LRTRSLDFPKTVRYTIVSKEPKGVAIPTKNSGLTNKWTCHKLESFSDFLKSYTQAARKADYSYLELYSGYTAGPCLAENCQVEGTASRVLRSRARFSHLGFLAKSHAAALELKSLVDSHNASKNSLIIDGNPNNERTLRRLLDVVPRSSSSLVFIDSEGYRKLNWSTLEQLVQHGKNWQGQKMDLLIIFPLEMALLRNLMRPECQDSITRFYGNQQWEEIKRQKTIQKNRYPDTKRKLVELYKNGLWNLGYRYVEDYKPASPTHNPYYHLIYASDNLSRIKYLRESWGKSRYLPCELLYNIRPK
jgi:three-Cys-motif partner protein